MTNDVAWTKWNVNIWWVMPRVDMMKVLKQNVKKYSDWITWCNANNFWNTINESMLNYPLTSSQIKNCTKEINWESISFIKWNVNINCSWTCKIDNWTANWLRRTIIVKDWYTFYNSNISTKWTKSQLFIWTIAEAWLENVSINSNLSFNINNKTKWWAFINTSITNIDAFIVSQWPVVSYDWIKLYWNSIESGELRNQLFIFWSLFSLNSIGWFKAQEFGVYWPNNPNWFKCPYIIWNCDSNISWVFDLAFLRRYVPISKKFYDPTFDDSTFAENDKIMIPYHPDSKLTADKSNLDIWAPTYYPYAMRSCQLYWPFKVSDNSDNARCTTNLRYISDPDYKKFSLVINRDKLWDSKPSIMFEEPK
jgi:hypothetical protein